jgi:hypothetical protein
MQNYRTVGVRWVFEYIQFFHSFPIKDCSVYRGKRQLVHVCPLFRQLQFLERYTGILFTIQCTVLYSMYVIKYACYCCGVCGFTKYFTQNKRISSISGRIENSHSYVLNMTKLHELALKILLKENCEDQQNESLMNFYLRHATDHFVQKS